MGHREWRGWRVAARQDNRPERDPKEAAELPRTRLPAGGEFDPAMSAAFIGLMRKWDDRTALRESA